MFEKLITTVLNKVLGDFIENIDPGQLKISITNGKVKLANMKLKSTLFNSLPVPFQLDYGQVGLINLTIPIWNMFSSPLVIEIEDVFGVVRPKRMDEWKEEVEVKNFRSNTQDTLDRFEVFQSNAESLKKKDPTSVDKLVAKIIDNLQITIKNVYFRYEDQYSAANQGSGRFAVGVMLKELSAYTTNETWNEKIMMTGAEITYKLGIIKGLTVFLDYDQEKHPQASFVDDPIINLEKLNNDTTKQQFKEILKQEFMDKTKLHKYILYNFSLEARLNINNNPKANQKPQAQLNLLLGGQFKHIEAENKDVSINFSVHQPQIVRILKLVEYIGYYNEFQRGSLADFYKNKITSEVSREYVHQYCEWKVMEVKHKPEKEINAKREEMKTIEDSYTADKLIVLRKFAMKLFEQEAIKIKKQEEIDKEVKKAKSEKKGWGLFMSKEKKQKIKNEVEDLRQKLQGDLQLEHEVLQSEFDAELMELTSSLSTQDYLLGEDFEKMPETYIRFYFAFAMPAMRLQFINEFDQNLFIASIEGCKLKFKLGIGLTKVKFDLNALTLTDTWCMSKVFPNVIETKQLPDKHVEGTEEEQIQTKGKAQALTVRYELNKNFTIAPFKIKIETSKTLFVVANFSFIKEVQRSFQAAFENETFDFTFYKEAATEKAINFMHTGKALIEQLKKGEYSHKALDISLFLSAPVFIVPQSIYDPTQPCIIADTGILDLQSKLAKFEQGKDYKHDMNPKHIYDVYEAKLHDLQIIIMDKGLNGISNYDENLGISLIKDFDAKLYFFNCFEPMHPKFPTAELSVVIENVHVSSGISNIQTILQVVNTIQNTMNAKEFQFFDSAIEEHKMKLEKQVSQAIGEKVKEKIEQYRKKQPQDTTDESDIQDEDELLEQLVDDGDEFIEIMKQNMSKSDIKKVAKKQQKVEEEKQQIIEELGIEEEKKEGKGEPTEELQTNFKIYCSINKVQLTFQDENYSVIRNDIIASDFLHIVLQGLELEIEIDRKEDISINLNVLKFVIKDVSQDSNIAHAFRMILSSPLVEVHSSSSDFIPPDIQLEPKQHRSSEKRKSQKEDWIHENVIPAIRLITKSLLMSTDQEDFDEGFKDAISDEEERIFNELELRISIKKSKTNILSNLTDMRLAFSVPTGEKLMKNIIKLQDMLDFLEEQAIEDRVQMIDKYEQVIGNLEKAFMNEEDILIKKVFVNHSKARGIDPHKNKDIYYEGINKMSMVWDKQSITQKVEEQASKKAKLWIRRRLKTRKEEVQSSLEIKAALNNFSVWIPLKADSEKSQILSLSFMSLFMMEQNSQELKEIDKQFNQVIKKEKISSKSTMTFSITHFTIEMLTSNEYLRTLRSSYKVDINNDEPYSSSSLMTPCRLSVTIEGLLKAREQYSKNDIKVSIEPIYLKVGFKDIDFINVIYVQVDENIIKQLKEKENNNDTGEFRKPGLTTTIAHKSDLLEVDEADFFRDLPKSPSKVDLMRITKREQEQRKKDKKKVQQRFKNPEQAFLKALSVNVDCEVVALALHDDTECVNINLVQASIHGLRFRMKQNTKPEDEATFILTKLGITQKLHKEYSKAFQFREIEASIQDLYANYYNQKSLAFEPLIEPWELSFKLEQEAPYVEQVMKVTSNTFLNVNLTFGMALTVRRIIDRVQESLKSAKIIEKLNKDIPLNVEELEFSEHWNQKFGKKGSPTKYKENQIGFIFQNYTSLPLKYSVTDDTLNDDLLSQDAVLRQEALNQSGAINRQPGLTIASDKIYEMPANDDQFTLFQTYDELYSSQRDINQKRTIGKTSMHLFEEQPLKVDLKIGNIGKLTSIPIEGLGVHSYGAEYHYFPDNVSSMSMFGGNKKSKVVKKIGVVVNIKMEGLHKKVSIESQLLLSNNNSREITIVVCPSGQSEAHVSEDQRITIESGGILRAPLSWFISEVPLSMHIESKGKMYKLFSNISECFSQKPDESLLRKDHSKVVLIDEEYYTSVDIQGYKCLPELPEDNPLQYLLTFNPPLKVTNYNFHPLDIRDVKQQQTIIAAMAPKESSYINTFNTVDFKSNIKWTFYESNNQPYSLVINNFSVVSKLNQVTSYGFQPEMNQGQKEKSKKLEMELRNAYYLELPIYDENFEYRSRKLDISTAAHMMIFPRFMIINKTAMPIHSENQVFLPRTNEFFNTENEKVRFKVQGYKQSHNFEVKTIGMAGSFELELERAQDVLKDKLPQPYVPQKLEMGIQIQSAPTPFNKTTLIYIVPRYVIVNQLGHPIVVKQLGAIEQILVSGQQVQWTLESKQNKVIMVREAQRMEIMGAKQGRKLFSDLAGDQNEHWSSPFSIEDVDDFQLSFMGEQGQNKDPQWYEPSPQNHYRRYVRAVVTSQDDATILIVLSNPLSPEYEIVNKTNTIIKYGQIDESVSKTLDMIKSLAQMSPHLIGDYHSLHPQEKQPYVWQNKTKPYRRMLLNIEGTLDHINIDNALKQKEIQSSTGSKYHVDVRIIGNAKRIEITYTDQAKEQLNQASLLQDLLKQYQGQQFTIGVELKGIGLSFVDDLPRELLFLSVYKIGVQLKQHLEIRADSNGIIETITDLKLQVSHLQLDNMINQIMPVVLAPIKPLIKKENNQTKIIGIRQIKELEEAKDNSQGDLKLDIVTQDEVDFTPFIQINLCTAESKSKNMTTHVTSIRAFQFQIQEFIFQVETSIINNNLKFVDELIHTFIDQKEFQVKLASFENYEKHKLIKREEVCPVLSAEKSFMPENTVVQSNKMFMKYIHLGAIKANVTFRLEKRAVEIDITNPQKGFGALNVLYSFLSGIASFSNSPLVFKELIMLDSFTSMDTLAKQLGKNYATQGIRQFYKILGSSDLIGNPIGLVDKLGTGVIEFFNEPRKGLLKGPEEFVGGIGKGVKSLASNVVSGSMDSVSRITGSLYSVIKNVAGEEKTELKKPDHVFDGLYQGVKGGVSEIVGGVTGIFTKPIQKTKEEGAKGFFKGIGSGLLGAISAPVTATLRAGSSISQGVASTATSLGNIGKVTIENVQNARFRPPRYINTKHVLEIYNEDIALVKSTLLETNEGRYANQDIKFFCTLPETKPNGEYISKEKTNNTVLIITEKMLLYVKENRSEGSKYGKIQILFKTKLRNIQRCEVYKQQPTQQQQNQSTKEPEPRFMLVITWYSQAKGQHKYAFSCHEYHKFEKVYNILSSVPQVEAVDSVKQRKEKAARFCS